MKVNYCEVCGGIIKGKVHYFWCASMEEIEQGLGSSYNGTKKKSANEICSNCRKLAEDILAVRKAGLSKLKKEIEASFNIKPKKKK